MVKKNKIDNMCDVELEGHTVRIVLTNGAVRAGTIIRAYDDVILLESIDKQTALINRKSIIEIWEGLGEEEMKEEDKQ
jgi:sRNA-binding regulator protein Hfq